MPAMPVILQGLRDPALPHSLRQGPEQVLESVRHWLLGSAPRRLLNEAIAMVRGVAITHPIANSLYATVRSLTQYSDKTSRPVARWLRKRPGG